METRNWLHKLSNRSLFSAVSPRSSLSEVFHENTKLTPLSAREHRARIAAVLQSPEVMKMLSQAYKSYSLADPVPLPRVEARTDLESCIATRRSRHRFSGEAIGLEALSRLLLYSYGRTQPQGFFRAVPSAGGLYPLDLYLAAFRVEGLAPGLYHYDARWHQLDDLQLGDFLPSFRERVLCQGIDLEGAALGIVITATFLRSTFKYQDRGYRMVLIEAGEVAQNLSLMAHSLGLGSCLVGGFFDNTLSELLAIDGLEEAPLLPMVLGYPRLEGEP